METVVDAENQEPTYVCGMSNDDSKFLRWWHMIQSFTLLLHLVVLHGASHFPGHREYTADPIQSNQRVQAAY
jgi:hypothetical protein